MERWTWTLICVLLVAAMTIAGCGGETKTVTEKEPATPKPKPKKAAAKDPREVDSDKDGIPDAYDDKPNSAAAQSTSQANAKIGDSQTLAGQDGEKIKVTPTEVIDPLSAGEDTPLDANNRFVGVQFKFDNVGDVDYDDAPSNGAKLVTADDQQADTTIITEGPCSGSFSSDTTIAAGDSREGCIPFEVPQGSKVKTLQLSLNSGFSDDKAEWSVP